MLSPDVQPREQENTSLSFLCRSLKGPFTPELKSNSFLWPVDCASTHGPKASSSSIFFFFFLRVAEFSIVQYKLTSSTYKAIKDLNTSETKLKRFLLFWVFIWNTCLLFNCHVMSLSVTAYPFPWGRGMLLLEPIPALSQRQLITGPLLMSNVGFSILLKDTSTCSSALPGAGIWTSNLPITSWPALPNELQPPSGFLSLVQL